MILRTEDTTLSMERAYFYLRPVVVVVVVVVAVVVGAELLF